MQRENYSWNSHKLTNSLVWSILKMLAGILLDVFVTRLLLPRGRICSSSSREAEEEQETYSFFTLVLLCGWGKRQESSRRERGKTQKWSLRKGRSREWEGEIKGEMWSGEEVEGRKRLWGGNKRQESECNSSILSTSWRWYDGNRDLTTFASGDSPDSLFTVQVPCKSVV